MKKLMYLLLCALTLVLHGCGDVTPRTEEASEESEDDVGEMMGDGD